MKNLNTLLQRKRVGSPSIKEHHGLFINQSLIVVLGVDLLEGLIEADHEVDFIGADHQEGLEADLQQGIEADLQEGLEVDRQEVLEVDHHEGRVTSINLGENITEGPNPIVEALLVILEMREDNDIEKED